MTKEFDTLVLIGRFQPVHNGHIAILQKAITLAKEVIVIVGSADQPRTYKNPWIAQERMGMLQYALNSMQVGTTRVHIESNTDSLYNDTAWAARIQGIVSKYRCLGGRIGLIGHRKDDTTYYLDLFPQWELVEVPLVEPLDATSVRDLYFRKNANLKFLKNVVPQTTFDALAGWQGPAKESIIAEREFEEKYKQQFAGLAYPPIFVTVDAVVTCSGHILMVKRRDLPGKGLWALPGGFVNANTDPSVKSAMLRELREETCIKVPAPVLSGSIVKSQVFDAISRSSRGRTITHCFHIALPAGELPKVKGMDDAEKAKWVPIGELQRSKCFEDHYEIIQTMIGA